LFYYFIVHCYIIIQSACYSKCLTYHPFIHRQRCHLCKAPASSSRAVRVGRLTQGYLDTLQGGVGDRTSNLPVTTVLPPEPLLPLYQCWCESCSIAKHSTARGPYPDPFEPVDLVVEQHLGVGQVDVAVVRVVEQVSQQGEVVASVLGTLFGSALQKNTTTLGGAII